MAAQGARLIGGCCGTTPAHIAALAKAVADLKPVRSKQVRAITQAPLETFHTQRRVEDSLVEKIAQGERVIICELDPPKTLALEKFFAGAQALTRAGCDAITLADNSLAILRMSNLAVGAMLKERFGITPLLHISCRDRNVLGLQSELLGMAALGMRHVLPLTGDPARVGDHPGAKSVYDVNSIELMAIIKQLNEGFTHSGKPLKAKDGFRDRLHLQSEREEPRRAGATPGAQSRGRRAVRDDAAGFRRGVDRRNEATHRASRDSDVHRHLAVAERAAGGVSA